MKKLSQEYIDYINSQEWSKIRNKVLMRDNFKCSVCGNTRGLQVHHLNYNHFMNEENHLEDLMTLCNECHEKIEKQKEENNPYNNYLEIKQENINRYQLEKEQREELYRQNYENFMRDYGDFDYSNINNGCYDFCDLRFLKKFIISEYGEEFYNNLRKTDIQKYFGNKRNIVIIDLIGKGERNGEILKHRFTQKRINSMKDLIKQMQSYNDIYELMAKEKMNKIIYGGTLNREIIEALIKNNFIKDKRFLKDDLIKNLDTLFAYNFIVNELGEENVTPPILITSS